MTIHERHRRRMRRYIVIALFLLMNHVGYAHGSFSLHMQDFYCVLGLEVNTELTEWMRMISSDMIDKAKGIEREEYGNLNFYDYIKQKYPPFRCKHRLLFHWGFNARPWSDLLDKKMEHYGFPDTIVQSIKADFIYEQKQRNRKINEETEELFCLASGGKEAGIANALVSIVYDTHLLGDYTPDNSDLHGLAPIQNIIGDLINAFRRIDKQRCSEIVKKLRDAGKQADEGTDIQILAQEILNILTDNTPAFLREAQEGWLEEHLNNNGFYFREENNGQSFRDWFSSLLSD